MNDSDEHVESNGKKHSSSNVKTGLQHRFKKGCFLKFRTV